MVTSSQEEKSLWARQKYNEKIESHIKVWKLLTAIDITKIWELSLFNTYYTPGTVLQGTLYTCSHLILLSILQRRKPVSGGSSTSQGHIAGNLKCRTWTQGFLTSSFCSPASCNTHRTIQCSLRQGIKGAL